MKTVLGLTKSNVINYVRKHVISDTSSFDMIFMIATEVVISKSFILIKPLDKPFMLLEKENFNAILSDKKFNNYIELNVLDIDRWGVEYINKVFKYVSTITVNPTEETDYNLATEYIIQDTRKRLTKLMVDYNRAYDSLTSEQQSLCSQLVYLAELKLCKEIAILNPDSATLPDMTYMYATVSLSDNRFTPILHVLDLYAVSPYSNNSKKVYRELYIPYNKIEQILNTEVIYLTADKFTFLYNVNSDYIEDERIKHLVDC